MYLNTVDYGSQAYGIKVAAKTFFSTTPDSLTPEQAAVLVGGAGDGLVAEAAALAKPFLCLPEPRPFGEQTLKAQRLAELGAACVLPEWPAAADWPGLLDRALALDPARIGALHAPGAVGRLAGWLDGVASAA